MTIEEQVQAGAKAFAQYEEAILMFKSFDMRILLSDLYKSGMIGYLEYQRRVAEFEALCSRHEYETFALHSDLTARAQELGIDLPQPKGGGSR